MFQEAVDLIKRDIPSSEIKPQLLYTFPAGIALERQRRERIELQKAFNVVWETGAFAGMRRMMGKLSDFDPVLELYPPDVLVLRYRPERVKIAGAVGPEQRPIWRSCGLRTKGLSYDDVHLFVTKSTLKTEEGVKIQAGGWEEIAVNPEVENYVEYALESARYLVSPYLDNRIGEYPRKLSGLSDEPSFGKQIILRSNKEILLK